MRIVATALLFTALAAGTATAQIPSLNGDPFVTPGGIMFSAGGDGVACTVKRVTVLAQNKADCLKIGGRMLRVKQAKAAQ
jgi:hypothetical protein